MKSKLRNSGFPVYITSVAGIKYSNVDLVLPAMTLHVSAHEQHLGNRLAHEFVLRHSKLVTAILRAYIHFFHVWEACRQCQCVVLLRETNMAWNPNVM